MIAAFIPKESIGPEVERSGRMASRMPPIGPQRTLTTDGRPPCYRTGRAKRVRQ